MARVPGSYPIGRWFESCCRYHFGPLVKRLRHRPFTAESWVQFPYGSPDSNARKHKLSGIFSFCGVRCGEGTRCAVSFFVWERIGQEQNALSGCTKSIVQEQNDSRTVAPKRLIQLSAAGGRFLVYIRRDTACRVRCFCCKEKIVENAPPERFQNHSAAAGTQGGAVLFAPPSKSCRFSHPPAPCAKSMAQGISPSADGDSEGCSPSKNTSPTALSWISLMGKQF